MSQQAETRDKLAAISASSGTMEDFGEAADLITVINNAKTNGDALGAILSYRNTVRKKLLADIHAIPAIQSIPSIRELINAVAAPALETESPSQELDHADTVLRVQAALGCTDSGWIDPSVILLRIWMLQQSREAHQRDARLAQAAEHLSV